MTGMPMSWLNTVPEVEDAGARRALWPSSLSRHMGGVRSPRGPLLLWLCVLLSPDFSLHSSFGLVVQWSDGLTLSNLLIPVLALPVMAWAWLRGRRLFPSPWPRCISAFACLLGWGALTWLPWLIDGRLDGIGLLSILAHWGKLLLIVLVAAHVTSISPRWRHRILWSFLFGMGVNALVGIGQAFRWLPVYSPLATLDVGVRVTGTFYDANMYGSLVALALVLAVACATDPALKPLSRWSLIAVSLALGINLVLAASRAGYLALLVAMLGLLAFRCWKPLLWTLLGCLVLAMLFPLRTMGRLKNTVEAGFFETAPDAATLSREQSMHDSVYQFIRHPWLGLGFGRSLYLGTPSRSGLDYSGERSFDPQADRGFTGAQNMFLTVLAETGSVGLLLYLGWLFVLFQPLYGGVSGARSRHPESSQDRAVTLAMMAGLAGLVVASCTVELFLNARILAIVLVLAGSWGAAADSDSSPETRHRDAWSPCFGNTI